LTLRLGRNLITLGYTSASGNSSMPSRSAALTEIIFPANAQVLTLVNTSSNPSVSGSLTWAVAQADANNVATVITFATQSGQGFATPQMITLGAPLDVTDGSLTVAAGGVRCQVSGVRQLPAIPPPRRPAPCRWTARLTTTTTSHPFPWRQALFEKNDRTHLTRIHIYG